jgi:3-deoxy-D-manno-octulosonic-acid transferase
MLDSKGQNKEQSEFILVIVPRHPQRFDEVFSLCNENGLQVAKSSKGVTGDEDILLIDEMGVLAGLYGIADMCFVGGSIANRGGHNALEAAVYGKPVIMGSSRHNNADICQKLSDANALTMANTALQISEQLRDWMTNPQERLKAGNAGREVIYKNQGAIHKTLLEIGLRNLNSK